MDKFRGKEDVGRNRKRKAIHLIGDPNLIELWRRGGAGIKIPI